MSESVTQDDLEIWQYASQERMLPPHQPVTVDIAARSALYAMAASNAYHQDPPRKWYFPLALLGWRPVAPDGSSIPTDATGRPTRPSFASPRGDLAYDILENSENQSIFAFRGTDNPIDYLTGNVAIGWSRQYAEARQAFISYARMRKDRSISLTGHSLGGGLALSTSVRRDVLHSIFGAQSDGMEGYPAIVFNTSPRIFDGLFNRHTSARRISIYQKGEILEIIRAGWNEKFLTIVPPENIYQSTFDYSHPTTGADLADNSHRADLLAYSLLKQATPLIPSYNEFLTHVQFE